MKKIMSPPNIQNVNQKLKGAAKLARVPIKIEKTTEFKRKPDWLKIKLPSTAKAKALKKMFQSKKLFTICEEASCPNLSECYSRGVASFMIMGERCTRRCSFCDVAHGRPEPLDPKEPAHLAEAIASMQLKYVVITSVDRDDLRDGGAGHFVACIQAIRNKMSDIKIEILVPDFRGRMETALDLLVQAPANVFNHNIETVPRIYKQVRPGADYAWSLKLLKNHKARLADIPTKSGLMLGLGETLDEVKEVMHDLLKHDVDMITLGQYLQPSPYHMPIDRYVTPEEFDDLGAYAKKIGFKHAASGPMVRSSYHADRMGLEV